MGKPAAMMSPMANDSSSSSSPVQLNMACTMAPRGYRDRSDETSCKLGSSTPLVAGEVSWWMPTAADLGALAGVAGADDCVADGAGITVGLGSGVGLGAAGSGKLAFVASGLALGVGAGFGAIMSGFGNATGFMAVFAASATFGAGGGLAGGADRALSVPA
jgi:hypothetical protein